MSFKIRSLHFFILVAFLFSSCSHVGTNLTKEGSLVVNGGKFKGLSWDKELVFKRSTWFVDLNMIYDVIVAEVKSNSPFLNWLYDTEKEKVEKCQKFSIFGVFSSNDKRVSENEIIQQIVPDGARMINVNGFHKNLSFHPVFLKNSLNLYRFEGICFSKSSSSQKLVYIPGFSGVNIHK